MGEGYFVIFDLTKENSLTVFIIFTPINTKKS